YRWDDWGSPLRPAPEDIAIFRRAIAAWHATNGARRGRLFLCGVTPGVATMEWPFASELVAMDRAESMVRVVWPGDIPGVRRASVGNWLAAGLRAGRGRAGGSSEG